jgi:ferredoxin
LAFRDVDPDVPSVEFRDRAMDCSQGEFLRDVLLAAGESPHNGRANALNCRGHGSCGTCAVEVDGPTSEPTTREEARLSVPPHTGDGHLRLACQTRVLGDLAVRKHPGFWGQHADEPAAGGE